MKKALLLIIGVLGSVYYGNSTTCPNAQVIPGAPTLPYTQSLVCGTADDINSTNASYGSVGNGNYYLGGLESVYTWTPTGSYSNVVINYTGQTWSSVWLYAGCPTSGGTLIAGTASTGSAQTLTIPGNLSGGTQYYLVFDTWPTPNSPCPGSFTMTGTLLSVCTAPPSPGNTLSSTAAACPSQPFTLSLQNNAALSGLSYQWQSSIDGITYANIVGATGSTYVATQTAAKYYKAIVTCVSEGTPVQSTALLVPMSSFLNCYCSSVATYTYDQDILNVTLGTLNNTSTCTSAAGPGSTLNSYSNFTAVAAPNLARGAGYNFSVDVQSCSGFYGTTTKAWIDYNQNGLFTDPGEEVFVSPYLSAAGISTATINIPLTAALGNTRMRVITSETSAASSITPCGIYYYGETEDYFVNIAPVPTCPQPTAFQWIDGTTTTVDLDWNAGGVETAWKIVYGAPGFAIGTGTAVQVTGASATTIPGLTPNSFYQAYIKGICGPADTSFYTGPVSFNTFGLGQYMEASNACGTGYVDISTNTTATNLNLLEDGEGTVTLPFPLYFQGTVVSSATVGNNGGIKFNNPAAQVSYSMDGPGVYPYIQDLGAAVNGGGVYVDVVGTAPNRKLYVLWKNIPHYSTGDPATFEFVFEEATSEMYYLYDDVQMGNATWDNGADAEIGVRGNQNIDISINNTAYLTNNSCVKLYYTNCPKPKNIVFSNITDDEFSVVWTAGLSNETSWTVEYGPAGFIPGTAAGTVLTNIALAQQQISGLTPITTYDVYIYASCANGDTSLALLGSVQTKPLCADPYALFATSTDADSIKTSWGWTQTTLPIQSFKLQYVPFGSPLYGSNSTIITANGVNFADTIVAPALMAGVTYQVYVQSVCPAQVGGGVDTSNFVGPFSVTMPLTNDTVCYAEALMTNGTVYTFTNTGATASNSVTTNLEQSIAPPATGLQTTTGWGNSTISRSTWFTFVAPASGQVRISGKDANFDGQIAVYKVGNCAQFSTFQLKAANDNEIGGTSLAPNFTICNLTPGDTYYLMHDPFSTFSTGTYSIKISAINLQAGSTASLINVCTGDSVDLYTGITGNDNGGVWSPVIPSIALVQDSIFASAGLAYQTFQFQYRMTDGCAYDSILASVKVYPPSHAGTDGSLVVCRNQPFNLLGGLTGNVDLGGTWYNPTSVTVPNGNAIADNFPGQYNYKYIVGNGVCPNDTAKVIVSVGTCNYLGLEDIAFEGFSLYPNPTDGLVYVSNSGSSEIFNYEVLDLNGRKVMTKENAINGATVTEIDLNSMETGIYMIHVFNGNAEKTFRVVVK